MAVNVGTNAEKGRRARSSDLSETYLFPHKHPCVVL